MRNLLNYILRNSAWFLAFLLIAFSIYLVFKHNSYQRSVYLSSANKITGEIYRVSDDVSSFFHLKSNNQQLLERTAELEKVVQLLKTQIETLSKDTSAIVSFTIDSIQPAQFEFISAKVVNISVSKFNNSLTINKGSLDGIKPDMGVISHSGVVGVVRTVSDHFSVVIPIINPKFRLGAKLINSDNFGSISWDGNNIEEAQLRELPKHENFNENDTVVTGFSRIFPEGIVIGYTKDIGVSMDDNFSTFNITLATNFHTLQHVLVIDDKYYHERTSLEASVN
ncbi:MAG TPA: rod shape-determining protein MreC [Dysgonamonadaceae bacterium]|nr:rod shape-determining protein MreC [Dysgonamonadaceae bacterium]HUI32115.1 rod shape-determining protein MreC [Dysgonamonadaceae bacterium]